MTQSVTRPLWAHPGHAHKSSHYGRGPPLPPNAVPNNVITVTGQGVYVSRLISPPHTVRRKLSFRLQMRKQAQGRRVGNQGPAHRRRVGSMGTGTSTLLRFLRVGGPWPVGTMTGLSTSPADLGEGGFSTGCRSPPGAGIPGSCCTSLPWFGPFPPLPLQLCRPAPPSASTEREPTLWESLPSRVQERQEPRHRPSQFSGFTHVDCVSHVHPTRWALLWPPHFTDEETVAEEKPAPQAAQLASAA